MIGMILRAVLRCLCWFETGANADVYATSRTATTLNLSREENIIDNIENSESLSFQCRCTAGEYDYVQYYQYKVGCVLCWCGRCRFGWVARVLRMRNGSSQTRH